MKILISLNRQLFPLFLILIVLVVTPSNLYSEKNSVSELAYLPFVTSHTDFLPTYKTYGLNFSPYIDDEDPRDGGDQITDVELETRLDSIADYTHWIRTFGCNEDLKEAGEFAHERGVKSAIGAWLGPETTVAEQDANRAQINCLKEQALSGNVDLAIVGSEVLLRNDLAETKLLEYIVEVQEFFATNSLDIDVTFADVYGELLAHPNVIEAVDVVFVNYYPYWEGRSLEYAVAYVHQWHQTMVTAANGKEVIVSETGWPSCGNQLGDAIPSKDNASFYFLNFVSWARANDVKYFYFEAFDEPWKSNSPEGPQGACWGVWDKDIGLKKDMIDVFNDETIPDNWTEIEPEEPVIDFPLYPDLIVTNLSTFVVAGSTNSPSHTVWLNGDQISDDDVDDKGNFAIQTPLSEGENILELVIKSNDSVIESVTKTVEYDPAFLTDEKKLLYVNSVSGGSTVPAILGTIVIDLEQSSILGLIESKYIAGISPDGEEIYMTDKTVISTATHQEIRQLPLTQTILLNGFIVSEDGLTIYSRNERLDVVSNTLLTDLPIDISTGSSYNGAPKPGGPTISLDGETIFCCNDVQKINTLTNLHSDISIDDVSPYLSDIIMTPDQSRLLISQYSGANGRLKVYDATSFQLLDTVIGLGDFVGEIRFSQDGTMAIVGSAGNAASATNGKVTVIDLNPNVDPNEDRILSQIDISLADNLAISENNEIFVASGSNDLISRLGVEVLILGEDGELIRVKNIFLGINGFQTSSGKPRYDQIRRIIYKP